MMPLYASFQSSTRISAICQASFSDAFLIVILTDIVTIAADYLASKADDHYQALPLPLVSALNMLYFAAFIARALAFFRLAIVLLKLDHPGFSGKKGLVYLVFLISEGIVLSSPLTVVPDSVQDMIGSSQVVST